jgi:transcriptional regulator with XRE-family HTH domain
MQLKAARRRGSEAMDSAPDTLRLGEQFGNNLSRCRRLSQLSRTEVADRVDVHPTYLGRLERGDALPRLDTIIKLSAGVNASPCTLLAGMRWRPGYFVEGDFWIDDWISSREGAG